ncbi:MAG: hypothetical protein J6W00_10880 [Lentisphaeria bacterium]|nr:hypothetical protein [Lentisphaeria bacterium]
MAEFYRDEHPKEIPPGGWVGATVVGEYRPDGPMGGWGLVGGGEGGGGGGGGDNKWYLLGAWTVDFPLLLTDSHGRLLCGKDDLLLYSSGGCLKLKIECQIAGDEGGKHVECILIAVDAMEKSNGRIESNMLENLLLNGYLSVTAKWQAGHYNIDNIHTVRFRLNESEITPWIRIPLDATPCEIMQIKIVDGQIRLIRANKR